MLKVKNLTYRYGKIQALRGVDFEVNDGEIMTIIGSNGAGKSTLMKCIMGLLKPEGEITFNGEKLAPETSEVVRKGITLVPEGRMIFPNLTVEQNLLMGGYTIRDREPGIKKAFEMFPRLKERRNQRAGTLSGGEQQMLAMARGVMSEPKVLLLDEPSLGLAPLIVNDVINYIKEINQAGITVLMVEQNARKALSIAHRACVLELGRVTLSGDAGEIAQNSAIIKSYLGGVKQK